MNQEDQYKLIFSGDDTENKEFSGLKIENDEICNGFFGGCEFKNCSFVSVDFAGTAFRDCKFTECELILIKNRQTTVSDTVFDSCKLMGLDFSEFCRFSFSPEFRNCLISDSSIFGVKLLKSVFSKCTFRNTDFIESDLTASDFRGSVFEEVMFSKCRLDKADFRDAAGFMIDPLGNSLKKNRFFDRRGNVLSWISWNCNQGLNNEKISDCSFCFVTRRACLGRCLAYRDFRSEG